MQENGHIFSEEEFQIILVCVYEKNRQILIEGHSTIYLTGNQNSQHYEKQRKCEKPS